MTKLNTLLDGYKRFHAQHFAGGDALYESLAKRQIPKTMVIGCSDSRVDPAILFDADPGDIFVVRNVANLVPPCEDPHNSHHGTSSALQFATLFLKVEHIVVLGHSSCGGIEALMTTDGEPSEETNFILPWVNIAKSAKERTLKNHQGTPQELCAMCEKESIKNSINNLMTFPWVRKRVEAGEIELHGLYFSIQEGSLQHLQGEEFVLAEVA